MGPQPPSRAPAQCLALLLPALLSAALLGCGPSSPPDAGPLEAGPLPRDGGRDASGQPPPCQPIAPRETAPEVWVGPEGLRARVEDFIDGARSSLWVGVYELNDPPLIEALGRAAERGVRVRVLLDGRRDANARAREELPARGVRVEARADPFPYYHLKVLVRDEAEALVGSANLNGYSMSSERNHVAMVRDHFDVQDLMQLLRLDAAGDAPSGMDRCTRLVLSPLNARERLMALIGSARERLNLQQLSLSDEAVRELLARRAAQGVQVRVILADPAWIEGNAEAMAWLSARGVSVRILRALENHAKLILVDGVRAYVGSHNLSWTSIERNREVGLVLTRPEAIEPLQDAFDTDWMRSSSE